LVHFDFDDRYADEAAVGHAISRREGVLLSVVVHAMVVALALFGGRLAWFQPSPEELERRRQALEQQEQQRRARFVFVEPLIERTAPPRLPQPDLSDRDRRAAAPQRAESPVNPLPRSLGNTPDMTESPPAVARPEPPQPEQPTPPAPTPPAQEQPRIASADRGRERPSFEPPRAASRSLGDALRNLQQYVRNQTFHNPQGGTAIQFDTKGVEFGPWIRRFVAQVRRNWFVPQAAWAFKGRVVLQFNIHKDGRITDLVVVQPSEIDAFNRASYDAIVGSSPTEPLPPEYPEEKALFTVTFSYNEPLN
jgi:TonB family protein